MRTSDFKMNKLLICALFIASAFVLFFSCQRELSADPQQVSTGSLNKDSNGNCEPVIIAGVYHKGQSLADSNYLEVSVNITLPGSYTITTDTVNGYSFKASGIFTNSGPISLRLPGYGIPVNSGTDYFKIRYNASACQAAVAVIDTTTKTASYSLNGDPGACLNDTVYGSYIKGITLDTDAMVKISLNVITPGTYTITTNTVNGYNFSAAGTFLNTGIQPFFLNASGKPLNKESDIFVVTAGNSTCSFTVDVLTPVAVTGNDYFPLSFNSYWIYNDLLHTGDTIVKTVADSTIINSHLYKTVREDLQFGGPYLFYYRKSGSDYFEYAAPNEYTTYFQYKKPVNADIPFLKENLVTGFTWQSPEYIDTSSDGNIISLKYAYSCIDANATITIGGKAFANVYKIKMLPSVKLAGGGYIFTNEAYLFCYAKGIGLIYLKKTLGGFTQQELQIRNWQVY